MWRHDSGHDSCLAGSNAFDDVIDKVMLDDQSRLVTFARKRVYLFSEDFPLVRYRDVLRVDAPDERLGIEADFARVVANEVVERDSGRQALKGVLLERLDSREWHLRAVSNLLARQSYVLPCFPQLLSDGHPEYACGFLASSRSAADGVHSQPGLAALESPF